MLLSGGDPLTLGDDQIEWIIAELRKIPHVEIIRIGSRTPAVLPQRITPQLVDMLTTYHPIWFNTHFNHPNEITQDAARACDLLTRGGIPVGNQSVLLRGVNDRPDDLVELSETLFDAGVLPYYLHLLDPVAGAAHFDVPLAAARELIAEVAARLPGYLVPRLVREDPGAPAKTMVPPASR